MKVAWVDFHDSSGKWAFCLRDRDVLAKSLYEQHLIAIEVLKLWKQGLNWLGVAR